MRPKTSNQSKFSISDQFRAFVSVFNCSILYFWVSRRNKGWLIWYNNNNGIDVVWGVLPRLEEENCEYGVRNINIHTFIECLFF